MVRLRKETYTGLLSEHDYGEGMDIIFLSSLKSPLIEELEWISGKEVTVKYWITDKECTAEEAKEDFIHTVCGAAKTKFGARYSDYTGYLWTDEELMVGGHDLITEIRSHVGKWLILEIETHYTER